MSAADERAVVSDDVVTVVPAVELVFGIQLPTVALSTMVAAPWERDNGAGVPELVQAAQAADRAATIVLSATVGSWIPNTSFPAGTIVTTSSLTTARTSAALTRARRRSGAPSTRGGRTTRRHGRPR